MFASGIVSRHDIPLMDRQHKREEQKDSRRREARSGTTIKQDRNVFKVVLLLHPSCILALIALSFHSYILMISLSFLPDPSRNEAEAGRRFLSLQLLIVWRRGLPVEILRENMWTSDVVKVAGISCVHERPPSSSFILDTFPFHTAFFRCPQGIPCSLSCICQQVKSNSICRFQRFICSSSSLFSFVFLSLWLKFFSLSLVRDFFMLKSRRKLMLTSNLSQMSTTLSSLVELLLPK